MTTDNPFDFDFLSNQDSIWEVYVNSTPGFWSFSIVLFSSLFFFYLSTTALQVMTIQSHRHSCHSVEQSMQTAVLLLVLRSSLFLPWICVC